MELSGTQKMIKSMSSEEKFAKMEAESKLWRFTCEHCGKESSIWEAGGVRQKASGNPTKKLDCPHCQKSGMQKIYKVKD